MPLNCLVSGGLRAAEPIRLVLDVPWNAGQPAVICSGWMIPGGAPIGPPPGDDAASGPQANGETRTPSEPLAPEAESPSESESDGETRAEPDPDDPDIECRDVPPTQSYARTLTAAPEAATHLRIRVDFGDPDDTATLALWEGERLVHRGELDGCGIAIWTFRLLR